MHESRMYTGYEGGGRYGDRGSAVVAFGPTEKIAKSKASLTAAHL